jgi:hypothetical protein
MSTYFLQLRERLVEKRDAYTKAIEALDVALALDGSLAGDDASSRRSKATKAKKRTNERTNERTKQRARQSSASEPP